MLRNVAAILVFGLFQQSKQLAANLGGCICSFRVREMRVLGRLASDFVADITVSKMNRIGKRLRMVSRQH